MILLALHRVLRSACARRALAVVVTAFAWPAAANAQVFTNVTAAAGINHSFTPPSLGSSRTAVEQYTGGAAAGDFDGDGWVDLYVSRFWDTDILYRNNHDGTFSNVTGAAFGLPLAAHQTNGAAWGDVDNDGDLDLAVSTIHEGRHLFYVNDGAGHFTEEGVARGVTMIGGQPTTSGTSASMGDYDGDGYLDMYITEWRSFTVASNPAQSRLFRNLGAANPGHFVDATASAGVAMDATTGLFANMSLGFTPRFSDLDRDGHTDIAVISDAGTSRLFWNNGNGTFTDGSTTAGDVSIPSYPPGPGVGAATDDMGFTLADFNRDGLLDWFVTSIGNGSGAYPSGNRLFLNNGNRTFTDVTQATGVREGGWGWGADAIDYDNDADFDIVETNGFNVAPNDQTRFFKNIGSAANPLFVNQNTAVGTTDADFGRGLLTFDYDRDGDQDVFLTNLSSAPVLYRNDGGNTAGDWLQIRTVGTESNRDGIGAYVTVTPDLAHPEAAYVTEIDGSSNFLGQSEMIAHFGLGDVANIARIDVLWPSGYAQRFTNVAPNQRVTITEGLLADFNGDDVVDGVDLGIWRDHVGASPSALPQNGDANRDGNVDGDDFLLWQRELGRTVDSGIAFGMAAAVPEASSALVMAAAIGPLVAGRRRVRRARLSRSPSRGRPLWPAVSAFTSSRGSRVSELFEQPLDLRGRSPRKRQACATVAVVMNDRPVIGQVGLDS